jgi:hypothetical protein
LQPKSSIPPPWTNLSLDFKFLEESVSYHQWLDLTELVEGIDAASAVKWGVNPLPTMLHSETTDPLRPIASPNQIQQAIPIKNPVHILSRLNQSHES